MKYSDSGSGKFKCILRFFFCVCIQDKDGRISLEEFVSGCKRDLSTSKALALYEGSI